MLAPGVDGTEMQAIRVKGTVSWNWRLYALYIVYEVQLHGRFVWNYHTGNKGDWNNRTENKGGRNQYGEHGGVEQPY